MCTPDRSRAEATPSQAQQNRLSGTIVSDGILSPTMLTREFQHGGVCRSVFNREEPRNEVRGGSTDKGDPEAHGLSGDGLAYRDLCGNPAGVERCGSDDAAVGPECFDRNGCRVVSRDINV